MCMFVSTEDLGNYIYFYVYIYDGRKSVYNPMRICLYNLMHICNVYGNPCVFARKVAARKREMVLNEKEGSLCKD